MTDVDRIRRALSAAEGQWHGFTRPSVVAEFNDILAEIKRLRDERESLAVEVAAAETKLERMNAIRDTAQAVWEQVEMDESIGVCLTHRAETLRLGAALMALERVSTRD